MPVNQLSAEDVCKIRTKLNLTQVALARHLGYPNGQIVSHWEAGRKRCVGANAQILRLYDRSNGKAMEWAFLP